MGKQVFLVMIICSIFRHGWHWCVFRGLLELWYRIKCHGESIGGTKGGSMVGKSTHQSPLFIYSKNEDRGRGHCYFHQSKRFSGKVICEPGGTAFAKDTLNPRHW